MLVNHLRHRVAKQNDVLVEGLDLPLKLDAVDEIDGNGDMFLSERIEERILQKLSLVVWPFCSYLQPASDAAPDAGAFLFFYFSCANADPVRSVGQMETREVRFIRKPGKPPLEANTRVAAVEAQFSRILALSFKFSLSGQHFSCHTQAHFVSKLFLKYR